MPKHRWFLVEVRRIGVSCGGRPDEGELVAAGVGVGIGTVGATDDAERSGIGERMGRAEALVAALEIVGGGAGLFMEESDRLADNVSVGLVDGAALVRAQEEPAVDAPEEVQVARERPAFPRYRVTRTRKTHSCHRLLAYEDTRDALPAWKNGNPD